jgi:hypothetical protein
MPSIFFRIELILALEFQAEQPGTVNSTIFSPAKAMPEEAANKMRAKVTLNIFFIFHLSLPLCIIAIIHLNIQP